eukprot:CAMPEP_0116086740 /NCGR_PEP_ID=MMETSP0327-20121206/5010_1 /TAXON_ID=44447 /ORGANISM="Pseudo-nitzschia delicatissima, Strain B596" /LENGTH=867 /DNA_ID=CAMNT_0003577799 /DNA_START=166 /DNA_END=2769 /DNA_ORIENTATION=+
MASAVVASTSATTPPSSTAVARRDDGDLDRDDPMGSVATGGDNAEGQDTMDRLRDATMENKTNQSHNEQQQQQQPGRMQNSQPLSEKIRSEKAIQNEYNKGSSSTNSSNNDPSMMHGAKGFGEGPLPRELRRIIMEVAKTGKCSWLYWNHEITPTEKAASASKSARKMAPSSSSPNQYSPSFANNNNGGVVVRKQPSFGGNAARRSTGLPPRKRHRNGVIHKGGERMRFGNPDGAFGRNNASTNSRKRPLILVRTNSANAASSNTNANTSGGNLNASSFSATGLYPSAPSSVGSARSTGSEPDYDSAPYECDSEGTSATTNSEISQRKTTRAKRSGGPNTQGAQISGSGLDTWTDTATLYDGEDEANSVDGNNAISPYKTLLQTAFRGALGLVLDYFYQNRGNGYKLSPAEKKRNDRFAETLIRSDATMTSDKLSSLLSSEYIFQQRRQRLMAMLLPSNEHEKPIEEPPFTIQRIAEVLVAPDRYYTQTHKLCNCIEKLLLVNSSTDSFGGSTGGDTSQRRREERELAALADEKGRQEIKLRQRRIAAFVTDDHLEPFATSRGGSNNEITPDDSGTLNKPSAGRSEKEAMATNNAQSSSTPREILEALTRAHLRTRFDHVGTDAQQNAQNADVRNHAENRRMTNSPPLPGLNMTSEVASGANISVAGHGDTNGYVRHHLSEQQQQQQQQDHGMVAQVTSPLLFSSGSESNLQEATATNINILQYHHAVALAGANLNRSNNPTSLDNLMTIDASTISQMRSQTSMGPGSESTDGRSSASNSDIDSESDDISFDDSASDRSDGSDSGSTSVHHEPFTAARAMVLNRIQQQQRLQNRPPADSEYQSGDSIDSTRAEDSGGSDSSSSDLAD